MDGLKWIVLFVWSRKIKRSDGIIGAGRVWEQRHFLFQESSGTLSRAFQWSNHVNECPSVWSEECFNVINHILIWPFIYFFFSLSQCDGGVSSKTCSAAPSLLPSISLSLCVFSVDPGQGTELEPRQRCCSPLFFFLVRYWYEISFSVYIYFL